MNASMKRLVEIFLVVAAPVLLGASGVRAQTASQLYAQGVQAYHDGDVEQAKRKLKLTLEVDSNFRPATALLGRIALEQQAASGNTPAVPVPARSLERMVVPVEFNDTSLQSALEYLKQRIASGSGGAIQVNFVVNLPPNLANKKVTLQMDHVPVAVLLHYLGDMTGVNFQVQKYAILVTPATATPAPTP